MSFSSRRTRRAAAGRWRKKNAVKKVRAIGALITDEVVTPPPAPILAIGALITDQVVTPPPSPILAIGALITDEVVAA